MADRAAIVTGASRGIGLALAEALGEEGYGLTLTARKPDTIEQTAHSLRERGLVACEESADARDALGADGRDGEMLPGCQFPHDRDHSVVGKQQNRARFTDGKHGFTERMRKQLRVVQEEPAAIVRKRPKDPVAHRLTLD